VRALSERDATAVLSLVGVLGELDDAEAFPPSFLAQVAHHLGTRYASYSELDRRNERTSLTASWADGEELVWRPLDDSPQVSPYWRLRDSHPCCRFREQANVWTKAHTVSDFASTRAFKRTEIWDQWYRELRINYWLDVGLTPHHGRTRVFLFTHDDHDFGEREKLILDLLVPHLEQRAGRVAVARDAMAALSAIDEETDGSVQDVVLATRTGTIEFASVRARGLMTRYFGRSTRLPKALSPLLHGSTVVSARCGTGRLTVRAARASNLLILLLAETDVRVDLLSTRQRQVLGHAAAGLTDAQIAEELGIAAGTVRKHLEQIYERLDVHNRTSAIALLRR
jgi:DNA-binding NarL/FixJ family response regulator